MMEKIVLGLIKACSRFIGILLTPIVALISATIPGWNSFISSVSSFFSSVTTYFGWIMQATLIDGQVLSFFILVMTAKLTLPWLIRGFKMIVKWVSKFL